MFLLFNRVLTQGDTAIGVLFKRGSLKIEEIKKKPTQVVRCKREVILCGGAVNTPWLLQSSGRVFFKKRKK